MDNQCTVQVKLELGHRAQLRKKPTTEGFTHDWMVFVRGPEQCEIQHFVEKVVFRLHDSFPKPKRVCKEPPYKVEESGYAGFIMPIEVYFKNKEEPRKVCFTYDLFLNLEGNPPVNHLRCEKLTFNNPTIEFRYKLLMAGGVMVMPEGAETVSRPSPDYPMLPTIPLSAFSDPKKTKPSHGSKDASRESSKACKAHKTTKEHRERPRKDSESRGPSKEPEREQARSAKDAARKLGEGRPPKEEKAPPPKAAFKEPKMALKETKLESMSPKGGPPPPPPPKSSSKRPAAADSPKPSAKKQKKSSSKGSRSAPSTSPRTSSSSFSDKKPAKDKGSAKGEKVKAESEPREIKKPPEVEESNSEDEASFKTEPGNAVCCEPGDGRTPGRLSYLEDPQLVQGHLSHPLGCWKFVECWIVPCLASFSLCSDPELWAGALPSCPPQALPVEAFLRPGLMHLHWEEVEASLRPPQLSGGAPAIGRCCSEWAGCGSSVCGLARCCSGITRGRLGFSPECGGASCAQRDF
ncbi:protein ENL isoform X3 [Camelus dromedarius]|uniref:protein ENL isoform X3 n=1 Tax=Camelus dromedarius TaxID=9838 RepID=UPI00311A707E